MVQVKSLDTDSALTVCSVTLIGSAGVRFTEGKASRQTDARYRTPSCSRSRNTYNMFRLLAIGACGEIGVSAVTPWKIAVFSQACRLTMSGGDYIWTFFETVRRLARRSHTVS